MSPFSFSFSAALTVTCLPAAFISLPEPLATSPPPTVPSSSESGQQSQLLLPPLPPPPPLSLVFWPLVHSGTRRVMDAGQLLGSPVSASCPRPADLSEPSVRTGRAEPSGGGRPSGINWMGPSSIKRGLKMQLPGRLVKTRGSAAYCGKRSQRIARFFYPCNY